MKPWREIVTPHPDVLDGAFQQAEFAADITAVHSGRASREYQDAAAFFQRTYITEGMRLLLISVMRRLTGRGGDPVIQLQTAFGGGKTHTMLAVYHLATRRCALSDLAGIPPLLDQQEVLDLPRARVAVIDGSAHAPGQPWHHGSHTVHTLWGELAWQLGGADGYALVEEADRTGTSPGKDLLRELLERCSPCVLLFDELVAYVRQFPGDQRLSGGTYDSNLSFLQAITEAVKLAPTAVLLASLPESEIEAGSSRGVSTLLALEKTFGRIQALWKPVATEEAFEIVRRRLFEPVHDAAGRNEVCRAFAKAYLAEGASLPAETQSAGYQGRLLHAYPIHPEVFDRLYEDWTTLEGFQRTRGVLKLMAKVIYRLWKDNNQDLLILPGSLPLYDGSARNELTYYLNAGWDAVIDKDIDGDRAETSLLESQEPRFGAVSAARRIGRTLFLGTAPSSVATRPVLRGSDRARILLGCLQPGQAGSLYADALNRLVDKLHYLNTSGDRSQDATRYWFDTRANLRREMEERKRRFDDRSDVRQKLGEVLKQLLAGGAFFDGVHLFTPSGDVPDDSLLRLVVLPPEHFYAREQPKPAFDAVADYVRNNGAKPRYRGNRLLFLAADHGAWSRLRDAVRQALAWESIVEDVRQGRLNIDRLQEQQADTEHKTAQQVALRVARDCYRWVLCPGQENPTDSAIAVEAFALNTLNTGALAVEIERLCLDHELVITAWSPVHLRTLLNQLYWKNGSVAARAMGVWEDTLRYLYLPRLRTKEAYLQAVRTGAQSQDFYGIAYGQSGERFEGFQFGVGAMPGGGVQVDDTLLLIEPAAAAAYAEQLQRERLAAAGAGQAGREQPGPGSGQETPGGHAPGPIVYAPPPEGGQGKIVSGGQPPAYGAGSGQGAGAPAAAVHIFHGTVDVNPSGAKLKLIQIAEEIISQLNRDPHAAVTVTVEIHAEFPHGAPEEIRRAVAENAHTLQFKNRSWE